MTWRLINADCIDAMAAMDEASVDAVVTDPPYLLAFMGKAWDANLNHGLWATEALRVLKPGAHLLAFGGTRTYHRLACALEDAGFEIRDCLCWLYGSGFPKSLNLPGGWGTALKPAFEPIVLARKPLVGSVAQNVLEHGTGALNIDGTRIGTEEVVSHHSNFLAFDGANARPWHEDGRDLPDVPHVGRWPANVVLDPEAAAMLDAQTGERPLGGTVKNRSGVQGLYDDGFGAGEVLGYADTGGASRFFYCPKADREERDRGLEGFAEVEVIRYEEMGQGPTPQQTPRTVVKQRNAHPTVKPVALMQWLVRLVTPPGGTVLDPFTGSGTTGMAALREGFNFIGIEREANYVEIARARIQGDAPLFNIPAEVV